MLRSGHAKIRTDEIPPDVASEGPEVVILFRDTEKLERLYRLRTEAVEPGGGPDMTGGSLERTTETDRERLGDP